MKTPAIIEQLEKLKQSLTKDLNFQDRRIEDLDVDLRNSTQEKERIEQLLLEVEFAINKLNE